MPDTFHSAAIRGHVLAALAEHNASLPDDEQVPEALDTRLIGERGLLDSVGLVGLIVLIEERLQRELGLALSIADERAFSQEQSPFRTLGALCDYVELLVREARLG